MGGLSEFHGWRRVREREQWVRIKRKRKKYETKGKYWGGIISVGVSRREAGSGVCPLCPTQLFSLQQVHVTGTYFTCSCLLECVFTLLWVVIPSCTPWWLLDSCFVVLLLLFASKLSNLEETRDHKSAVVAPLVDSMNVSERISPELDHILLWTHATMTLSLPPPQTYNLHTLTANF